jgi:hypothetical protein
MFQTSVKNGGCRRQLTTETLCFRENCFQKAKELNKRGV